MKEILRLQNLEKRNSLSKKQLREKSALIEESLLALPEFQKADSIMAYYGVRNEVETKGIIEKALASGKRVFLPATEFEKRKIVPVEIKSLSDLVETKHGLFEPAGKGGAESAKLDTIIVPGVAFDCNGGRIGMGMGFYDSLLRRTSGSVAIIGLCFEENLEEKLPCESHDIKMGIVVTDKRVVRCK